MAVSRMKPSSRGDDHKPETALSIRERALEAAGFTPETIGELVRQATDKLQSQLSATKIQFFSKDGIVADQRIVEDSIIQQGAAKELISLGVEIAGLELRQGSDGTKTAITFDLSGWVVASPEKPVTVDIAPEVVTE